MTLSEIVTLVRGELGTRYQLTPEQALSYVGIVQRMAFDQDIRAFLYWDYDLTLTETVPGTADKGPYAWPSSASHPDCRKLLGVTPFEDTVLVDYPPMDWTGQTSIQNLPDYPNPPADSRTPFSSIAGNGIPIMDLGRVRFARLRNNPIQRTFSFIDTPATDSDWRVVYYIRPKALRNDQDDTRILVPEEWQHHVLVLGALALAKASIWGDSSQAVRMQDHLYPFWEAMRGSEESGNAENSYSLGQPL